MRVESKENGIEVNKTSKITTHDYVLGENDSIAVKDSAAGSAYRLRLLNISPAIIRYSDLINDPTEERGFNVPLKSGRLWGKPNRYAIAPSKDIDGESRKFIVIAHEGVDIEEIKS